MKEPRTRRTLPKGTIVILDNDSAVCRSEVKVVHQTPNRLFTTIKAVDDSGEPWSVSTYRLTPKEEINK